MKKRVYLIAAVVSGALAVSGCTTNPYTGEREAGKSAIGAVWAITELPGGGDREAELLTKAHRG